MNFKRLQSFVLVNQKGSFSEAAKSLKLTQPAISSQIKGLEDELGVRLLDRSTATIQLTSAGDFVYEMGVQILEKCEELEKGAKSFQAILAGQLSVGASTIPGTYLLPKWIGGFHERFPQLLIKNEISDSLEIQSRLINKKVDVALTGAYMDSPLILSEPIISESLVLVAPTDHPLKQQSKIPLDELINYPVVLREEGSGTRLAMEKGLSAAGIQLKELKVVAHFGSTEAILAAVEGGLGISFVPEWAALQPAKEGRISLVTTHETLQQTYYLSFLKGYETQPKLYEFISYIRSKSPFKA
ncbi:selenium metabolism-associated LysR family transcriptional regulator [Pullulanibacillus sp. KACC 23026]|uniref:selenium metabolism-associated LysR family transcriptional regulator n=1 Tax=Pullulanibacillus sp. KACC 23026 TaxID=3028315 RepID=UPI0023B0A9E3|nr:selenium metabolism-associated LysR family transcriptional regulator [Pullulanibacillus sp. KACC 23026]WEG14608.1 selenium metabolism-associated LysR family transcriptional regulator [Pullulanibacillus sp. KACC 23026]